MRIAIVTDAWAPQVNGVVRTLQSVSAELERTGHQVRVISPDQYGSIPCPTYPEIRLAMAWPRTIGREITQFGADAVHLATEGPLCLAARAWCLRSNVPFTTAYHTHFPDYVAKRTGLPAAWFWQYIRWFHGPAQAVLVSTRSVREQLRAHGIAHVRPWGRGVDQNGFGPDVPPHPAYAEMARPIQLYVGRVAVEKNLEAFLSSGHPGTKVVVGDGPAKAALEQAFPDVRFMGSLSGAMLAGAYAGADVFVFPSRTDTFGLVMIEALACGTPIAAYPVTGPIDIVTPETGGLSETLEDAIAIALTKDRAACAAYGRGFTWEVSAQQFVAGLHPINLGELVDVA